MGALDGWIRRSQMSSLRKRRRRQIIIVSLIAVISTPLLILGAAYLARVGWNWGH